MRKRIISGLLAVFMCFMPVAESASVYAAGQGIRMQNALPKMDGPVWEKSITGGNAEPGDPDNTISGNAVVSMDSKENGNPESPAGQEGIAMPEESAGKENGTKEDGKTEADIKSDTVSGSNLEGKSSLSSNRMAKDTVTLTADYKDIRVTVTGSNEALPEGSLVQVSELDSEDLMLYATSIYDTEVVGNGHVAFDCLQGLDITILDADGNVIEPGEEVRVTISNAVDADDEMDGLSGNDAYEVYHITDEGKAAFDRLDTELTEEGLMFVTDSFSPYVIGRTTYAANGDYQADKPFLRSNGASGSKYFGYTGKVETWTAPQDGLYSLEAIGGGFAGADGSEYSRKDAMICSMGYGGYSIAYVNLHKGDTLYIAVGGAGRKSTAYSSAAGGWNGGGTGTYHAGSGGGATSFASKLIGDGTLSNYKNDMDSLVAVAGGAGGQNAAMDQKLSLVQMAAMSGLGGGETLSNLYAKIMEDPTVAVYGASKNKYYAFGKGQDSIKAATIKGSLYAGGAGGGGVYGGFSSGFYDEVENGVKSTFGGTGGTGYINFATDSRIYALNDKAHSSYTRSEWLETGNQADLVLGNGQAAINYLGKIQGSVTLNLGNDAAYNGQKGSVILTGDAGSTIDLSGVTAVAGRSKVVGFNVVSGDGKIAAKSKTFTFGEQDTVLIPLIYSNIDLVSTQKVGASEFKGYTYNNNVLLNWDEAGNNNKKTYYVHQSVDGGAWKQLTLSNYTQLTVPLTEFYYTGGSQRYTAPAAGTYYVRLYGAQGGSDGSTIGGYGGYVYGWLTLKKGDVVTVNVGGGGRNSSETNAGSLVVNGGWNGGGTCIWSGSGGGRTDIYVNGKLVAAAAGGGGASNGYRGHGARESTRALSDINSSWQGAGRTSYGSTLGDDRNDAGAGGAGFYYGGSYGKNENPKWGGGDGGHGGYNGYDSGVFSLVTQSGGGSGNGKNNSTYNGGLHGYAVIRPDVRFSVYQAKSYLSVTPDKAAPNKPFNGKVIRTDSDKKTADISWSAPADNGTSYRHKVEAYEVTANNAIGSVLGESNITTDNIVSGVAGYYYYSDTNASGTATKSHTYTVNPLASGIPLQDKTVYLHVAAVDRAGNLGATYNIPVNPYYSKSGSVTWVDNGNQYGLRPGQDIVYLYRDGVRVDQKTLSTTDDRASFTFDHLEYGHTYTVVQQDVTPYGVTQSDWDFVNTLLLHIHKDVRDKDGNDIDGEFVDTGDVLEYMIELGQQSDRNRAITVFDQVPSEVDYVSSKSPVTVIRTQTDLDAYNTKAKADGYAQVPAGFNLNTPIVVYQYAGASATSNKFSFYVKVKNTAETKHIVNQAFEYINVAAPGAAEKLRKIPSNEVENIVRYNPLKSVADVKGNNINKTSVSLGETIVYTITFENVGDEDETATVTDVLPQGLAFVEADNGGVYDETSRTITWTVTAKPHVARTVSFQAKVLVDSKDIYVRNTAKVELNKKPKPTPETENLPMGDPEKDVYDSDGCDVDGGVVYAGEALTYTVTYTNDSDETRKYTVTDKLPEDVKIVEILDGGTLQMDGRTVVWNADVASKKQLSVSVKVRVLESAKGKTLRNKATVRNVKPDDPDAVYEKETNETENPVMPDPFKNVSSVNGTDIDRVIVYENSVLTYTITYQNPSEKEKVFTVTDEVPAGTEFVAAEDGGVYDARTGVVTFTRTLAGKESDTVRFSVRVTGDAKDTIVKNKAYVSAADRPDEGPKDPTTPTDPDDPRKTVTNETENPVMPDPAKDVLSTTGVSIDKAVVYEGSKLIYTITYKNPADEEKIFEIIDMVPDNTVFVSAGEDGAYHEETGMVTFERTIGGHETDTVTFTVLVTGDAKDTIIRNTAFVSAKDRPDAGNTPEEPENPDDPETPNDPDDPRKTETNETENPVMPDPVKDVLSTAGIGIDRAIVYEGSRLVYTISYKNPSDEEKTFEIIDMVPDNTAFVLAGEDGVYDEETGLVTFGRTIGGHETDTVTFTVQVLGEAKDTIIRNTAFVSAKDRPGDIPDEPESPGETPEEPEKPGETPEKPETPDDPDDPRKIETNEVKNPVMPDPVKDVLSTTGVSIDKAVVYEGSKLIYTITYKNPADEEKIFEITDTVPDKTAFVSVGESGTFNEETGLVTFIRTVAGHEADTVTFTVEVLGEAKDTIIPNTAFVSAKDRTGDIPDGEPENPDETPEEEPSDPGNTPEKPEIPDAPDDPRKIETNKVINPVLPDPEKKVSTKTRYDIDGDLVYAGDELIFEITYKNPAEETKNYTITDKVPEWTEFVSTENDGVYDEKTGRVTFRRTVEAGETDTVSFTVLVLDEGKDNYVVNTAIVKAKDRPEIKPDGTPQDPPDPDDPQEEETNKTKNPVMPDPVKTVTDQRGMDINGYVVEAGSRLVYSISFENPTKLTKTFTVEDKLPDGVEFIRADHDGVYDSRTHTVTYTMDLPRETSHTVTCTVKVKDARGYTKLANTATVITDAGESDTNMVENETIVEPEKDVLDGDGKSINGFTIYWNKVVRYEITYTNYTDEPRDITIVDKLDGHLKSVGNPEDGGISDGGILKNGEIIWEVKNVPAGYTGKVSFSARTPVPAGDVDIPNTAVVTLHGTDIKSMYSNGKKDEGDMEFTTNQVMLHVPARPDEEEIPYGALEVEVIDEDTSELIPGNEVTVYDSHGNVIDQWISTTEPHLIEHLENGSYIIRQTTVVDGYIIVIGEKVAEVNNYSGTVRVTLVDRKTDAQPAGFGLFGMAPYTGDAGGGTLYLFICIGTLMAMLVILYIYWKEQKRR